MNTLIQIAPPRTEHDFTPDLTSYEFILCNTSGGKDSLAMQDLLYCACEKLGILDRLVYVHCDLGALEWAETREVAEAQAKHYGGRFEVVSRPQGDLLDHVLARGMWPGNATRYCTSEHKTQQVHKLMTSLVREHEAAQGVAPGKLGRPVRILNCLGIRADESVSRSKKPPFKEGIRPTNGVKHVDEWYPIFRLTLAQVWTRIKLSGAPIHYAYEVGMPRLSCVYCIFSPVTAMVRAARHSERNMNLLRRYVDVQNTIGHKFRVDCDLNDVLALALSDVDPGPIRTWEER